MSGLLDEDRLETLTRTAMAAIEVKVEGLRSILWSGTPPGMKTIRDEEEKSLYAEEMAVRAGQEQRGQLPGDLNTVTLNNPNVQEALAPVEGVATDV